MTKLLRPLAAAAFALLSMQAHAVYKCTDPKTGKVSYSDSRCPSEAAQAGVRLTPNVVQGQPPGDAAVRASAQREAQVGSLVAAGRVAVGMRETEVIDAWGHPSKVNTDLYAGNRVHKQMIFDRGPDGAQYVYTENGIVTAVQTRPGSGVRTPAERCYTETEIRNAGVSMNSQRLSEAERLAIRKQVGEMKPC